METMTILLPTQVRQWVAKEAVSRGIDASTLCSGIIAEHFLADVAHRIEQNRTRGAVPSAPQRSTITNDAYSSGFDVRKHFTRYPGISIQLAQAFVDAALKIPGTKAFATDRGVGFEPNFVFILYLRKKQPGGIGVSFYGGPQQHIYSGLHIGRNPNYSSAIVATMQELDLMLPDIKRAHDLRFL
jgi:hypothetical protein